MKIVATFSERLKKALEKNNISPSTFSELVLINKSTISQYLSGKYEPKRNRIDLFAKILNVDSVWLTGYDVPMERSNSNIEALSKKERLQYEDFMSEATLFFNDETIAQEDKEKLIASLQEVFFTAKLLNKNNK